MSPSRRTVLKTAAAVPLSAMAQSAPLLLYTGCYSQRGQGIGIYRVDPATGALTLVKVVAGMNNPAYLALDPRQRFLFSVDENPEYEGKPTGSVSAFAIDPSSGDLNFLNRQPSGGRGPAHLSVDPAGRYLLVANYGGGSSAALPIQPDGRLGTPVSVVKHQGPPGPKADRQKEPHAHMILPDPAGGFVMAPDLGLDRTLIFRFDSSSGKLTPSGFGQAQPGAGPRHMAFHPNRRWVFVINELDSTVTSFAYDSKQGALSPVQNISTLPEGYKGINHPAHILVAPSGRFLYGSNRGFDSIVIFSVNPDTGRLAFVGHQWTLGQTPRNFNLDPSGNFLYVGNQNSDNIAVFRVDRSSGKLASTGHFTAAGQPVCFVFRGGPRA